MSQKALLRTTLIFAFWTKQLAASEFRPTINAGLMQQPSSQYYHFVQGASGELSIYRSWSIRATYFERPQFKDAGFIDQDLFALIQSGASFWKSNSTQLFGYIGAGRAWGYIKEVEPSVGREDPRRTGYKINALALTMEGSLELGAVELKCGHTLLTGHNSTDTIESGVAWPFTIFYLGFSTPIRLGTKI